MKVIKTASGKTLKVSKSEWKSIGKTAGWTKVAYGEEQEFAGTSSPAYTGAPADPNAPVDPNAPADPNALRSPLLAARSPRHEKPQATAPTPRPAAMPQSPQGQPNYQPQRAPSPTQSQLNLAQQAPPAPLSAPPAPPAPPVQRCWRRLLR